jgi:hypothetical protein
MLQGEKKRREVALKFIEEFKEILLPVAPDIWGIGTRDEEENETDVTSVTVLREKDGKKSGSGIYFRYMTWKGTYKEEKPGFYYLDNYGYGRIWGTPLDELRGKDFWYVVQVLIEWIPLVSALIEKKEASRQALLALLK